MTMFAASRKENEGIFHNPIPSYHSVPWWSGFVSQSDSGGCGDQFTENKISEKGIEKGNTNQFIIFPSDCKTLSNGKKPLQLQASIYMQSTPTEHGACFELGFGQAVIGNKNACGDPSYLAYGPHITGRIMLPLNLSSDDGPIFVNAKQYHGIIRRRKSRAKAELEHKLPKDRKPYLHHSRHLHAIRRPRGSGGRFLNTRNMNDEKNGTELQKTGQVCAESQSSEEFQSESGNLNSPKEGRSNPSGTEVTSTFMRANTNHFSMDHKQQPLDFLSNMMNSGHGIVMPTKWVAAADGCYNLNV